MDKEKGRKSIEIIKGPKEDTAKVNTKRFLDIPPHHFRINFGHTNLFGTLCNNEDLKFLFNVLGQPSSTTSPEPMVSYSHFLDYEDLPIEAFIKLIKNFIINFVDHSQSLISQGYDPVPNVNVMWGIIYGRIPYIPSQEAVDDLPTFILEPPNLYIEIYNKSGNYNIPLCHTLPNWEENHQRKLQKYKKMIHCEISRMSQDPDRFQLHITNLKQFSRLIRILPAIHRFNPKENIDYLIYTPFT